jgi:hypothetical protein
MLGRGLIAVVVAATMMVGVQVASADPTNAKNSQPVTAVCAGQQVQVVVNGNGKFTPAHFVDSTSVFVPTALDITFSFTPTGGTTQTMTQDVAKTGSHANEVTCDIPAALNTFTSPEGTFSLSGTVTGFITPSSGK